MKLAKRISKISPSPTLSITAKAKRMQQEGIDVIGFGAGEPDFDTPLNIKEKAKTAIDKGFTKYTSTSGIKELKEAICEKLKKDNFLEYSPEEVIVCCGAKHAIFNAIMVLCDKDDEVILPVPYWVSYLEMIKIAQAKPVFINTDAKTNFKITPQQLKKAITSRTKLLILNSPSNPTGTIYEKKDLEEIADILVKKDVFCLSDEIYEKLIYDGKQHLSIASLGKDIKRLTILINGVSKAYSMTGWRIGYAAGPKEILQAMANLQDHSTSNPTSISQYASVEALRGNQKDLEIMRKVFEERRNFMLEKINAIKLLSCIKPQGAFYCWVNVKNLFGKRIDGKVIKDSLSLADLLLTKAKVAVVPGCVFGDDNYIRLSYATSLDNINKGLERIKDFINNLK
ncbi:MAG: pyridoxal phosphate-dependent aminotransferase [Candidatus Omnitrophica bacterium]|nr:pyridoxal phosphate-dependent aminotransferase [Candidatus Omnitrophota bacterium]